MLALNAAKDATELLAKLNCSPESDLAAVKDKLEALRSIIREAETETTVTPDVSNITEYFPNNGSYTVLDKPTVTK